MTRERIIARPDIAPNMPQRRGAMLVLIALILPILLFLVAMAVDVGYIQLVRTELRASTDAAARAAGEALSRTQSLGHARQAAKDLAAANKVAAAPLLLENSDIVFGLSTVNPNGSWTFNPDGAPINAVRITGRRTRGSRSGSVSLFFGRFLGVKDFEPVQSASSVRLDRDICLVIDRSSSMKLSPSSTEETMTTSDPRYCLPPIMNDSRWGELSLAVQGFLDALSSTPYEEHAALVSFASELKWCGVSNSDSDIDQALTSKVSLVMTGLDRISARIFNGSTNIAAGMDAGVVTLTDTATARPFAAKTMILLTDGCPTAGRSPVLAAQDAKLKQVTVHTITFGAATDVQLMADTAAITGGKHYHAPDGAKLKAIFKEIALSLPVVLTQ